VATTKNSYLLALSFCVCISAVDSTPPLYCGASVAKYTPNTRGMVVSVTGGLWLSWQRVTTSGLRSVRGYDVHAFSWWNVRAAECFIRALKSTGRLRLADSRTI